MRYFIIFYMFNTTGGISIFGSTTAKGNAYPSKKKAESTLKEGHKTEFIHVINIIELTEEDYNNWKNE